MSARDDAAVRARDLVNSPSLKHWGDPPAIPGDASLARDATVDCGWGRLLFGQTFAHPAALADALAGERPDERDIALYVRDPHVVVASAPQALFLDPSFTFRLDLGAAWGLAVRGDGPVTVRAAVPGDGAEIDRIYQARRMVPLRSGFLETLAERDDVVVLVAADRGSGRLLGVTMGVDHVAAMGDPDRGSSLWALAVDPQATAPGVGETLTRALAERFRRGRRRFMDLSVMHDNAEAIALYRKLGFEQVPVYCVKNKNPINEPLFAAPSTDERLNVYAGIIVDEARRRGIRVDVVDAESGLFDLTLGGRRISCRESLSDLTSAVALARCDDKALTRRIVSRAGVRTPDQIVVGDETELDGFLERHRRIVVKPARGEQGQGVSVDLRTSEAARDAYRTARESGGPVLAEEMVEGDDLRLVVIDGSVVAAAVRRVPAVVGDGRSSVRDLIGKQSRRRAAATGGESRIPCDAETERCVREQGLDLDAAPPEGETVTVRMTANLHTGGTIHDVTAEIHPEVRAAAVAAAEALDIPVTGLDFIVPDVNGPEYRMIEANERPGLANHAPRPTVERFVDFLFPNTVG